MHDLSLLWLCVTAFIAGAVNSVAGGGTLLTFPALLAVFSHFDHAKAAVLANATSTVALVPGSMSAAWGYRHQVRQSRRWLLLLIGPSLIGGTIGSLLVTRLDPKYFSALVPWLILIAASLMLADTLLRRKSQIAERDTHSVSSIIGLSLFQFAVAIYGGYFGAAIGILMLSALALMRIGDINRMNAVKTVLTVCINGTSVIVFLSEGDVVARYAIPMAVVSFVGGYVGARGALLIQPRKVRWIVIGIGFFLATYFFIRQHAGI
jgi:uncharacterized membrane protein YfcA